jgi:hypothetical protein
MSLKMRKILYASLTLVGCVVWLPLAFAGIALVVGAVGLLSIGALFRAIVALPITDRFRQRYFSAAIGIGIAVMVCFVVLAVFDPQPRALLLPVASGILLVAVGVAVLAEIHAKRT